MPPDPTASLRGSAFRPADVLARLTARQRFVTVLEHGTLRVELYAPRGTDPQSPHTRDEVYVVVSGRGQYFDGVDHTPFEPGDLLFAPAGCIHRFEDFTNDLAVWVLFYGSEGGEQA